jgi:trypsin
MTISSIRLSLLQLINTVVVSILMKSISAVYCDSIYITSHMQTYTTKLTNDDPNGNHRTNTIRRRISHDDKKEGIVEDFESRVLEKRIVGGTLAAPGSYPSMVFDGIGCAATLIHSDILLTAAHCSDSFLTNQLVIGGVRQDGADATEIIHGEFQVPHPNYNTQNKRNDIMIVKLKRPSTAPIQMLNFNSKVPRNNGNITAIGFGDTTSGVYYKGNLRQVTINVVPTRKCNIQLGGAVFGTTMICGGVDSGGKDTCQGDSGGPLYVTVNNTRLLQVGITSFGQGCGEKRTPAVYTRVSFYNNWIKNMICGYTSDLPFPDYCVGRTILSPPNGH